MLPHLVEKYIPIRLFPKRDHFLRNRRVAIAYALSGIILPGLHKFYLGQRGWGIIYLLLWPTHIPQAASVIEGLWYGFLSEEEFNHNFNGNPLDQTQLSQTPNRSQQSDAHSTALIPNRKILQSRIASNPSYQFQSIEEVIIAADLGVEIDVNRAGVTDWNRLPILTESQGQAIASLRQSGVQFHCLDDIAAALSMAVHHLKPIEPILRFYYYETDGLGSPSKINANQASIATLTDIPGISVALALQIIHHRTETPFRDLADLQKRLALDALTVESIMHYVEF